MDAKSGYHQIGIKKEDQEILDFFALDHDKYTFTVIPLGPCNALPFCTAMILDFKQEQDALIVITVRDLWMVDNQVISIEVTIIHL